MASYGNSNITFGFYNAVESGGSYDREYTAEQFSSIFDGIINDGVYATIGDCFHVKVASGFNILIGTGRAWFEHTWTYNPAADNSITLSNPDVSYDRIDAVIIRIDAENRLNKFFVVEGNTFNQDEYDPTVIIPDDQKPDSKFGLHDYPIAYIRVRHGTEGIQNLDGDGDSTDIQNVVGVHERTPWVNALMSTFNAASMISQWKAAVLQKLDYLDQLIATIEDDGALAAMDLKPIVAYNVAVPVLSWDTFDPIQDSEEYKIKELGYEYRAFVTNSSLASVISGMRPYVTWSLPSIDESGAGILNECQCSVVDGAGGVFIYADAIPEVPIVALTIECRHPVNEVT